MKKNIAIIGCGNLGLAITKGLLKNNYLAKGNISVSKRNITPILYLEKEGIKISTDNKEVVTNSEIIILAVKPYMIDSVLEELKEILNPEKHILISAASGVTISHIKEIINNPTTVFRVMPNTAATVNESITCFSYLKATKDEIATVAEIFNAIGETLDIEENLLEAATILGACGIAYVLRFIRAMIQGGIQIGFDSKSASKIVYQTVKGAAEILLKDGNHPEQEIDKVTTPKGCTIVGLNEMEHHGFSSSLIKGITTSFKMIEKK